MLNWEGRCEEINLQHWENKAGSDLFQKQVYIRKSEEIKDR